MPIYHFHKHYPDIDPSAWVDPSALIVGDVKIGADCSIWPMAVIRGDMHRITIGKRTNIQDHSILHITHASTYHPQGHPLIIGSDVTVGHRVTLHGCQIQDLCLIGIGSIVMDGACIESQVIVGAGSLVPPGKVLKSQHLWLGNPVQCIRPLKPSELDFLKYSAENYVKLKEQYFTNQNA